MRSSILVFTRAMVMLTFLVALPVFAIFGTAPWEAIRGYVLPTPAEEPLPEAPPFRPLANGPRRADAPVAAASLTPGEPVSQAPSTLPRTTEHSHDIAAHGRPPAEFERPLPPPYPTEPPPWRTQAAEQPAGASPVALQPPAQPLPGQPRPDQPHPAQLGGYESTPFPAPETQPYPATPSYPRTNVDPAVQPARAEWPTASPGGPGGVERPASIERPAAPATPGREAASDFQAVQQRLQALGATYYRLETWGQKNQFRFHCRMAVRENTHFARQFEATDSDPVLAMRKVLEQVEKWRAEHPLQP